MCNACNQYWQALWETETVHRMVADSEQLELSAKERDRGQ